MASIFPSPGQNFALLGLSLCLLSQVCPILPSWLTVASCSVSTQQDRLVRSGFGVPGGDGSAHVENNRPAVCFSGIAFSWMRFAFQSMKGLANLLIQKCGSWFEEGKGKPSNGWGRQGTFRVWFWTPAMVLLGDTDARGLPDPLATFALLAPVGLGTS